MTVSLSEHCYVDTNVASSDAAHVVGWLVGWLWIDCVAVICSMNDINLIKLLFSMLLVKAFVRLN